MQSEKGKAKTQNSKVKGGNKAEQELEAMSDIEPWAREEARAKGAELAEKAIRAQRGK